MHGNQSLDTLDQRRGVVEQLGRFKAEEDHCQLLKDNTPTLLWIPGLDAHLRAHLGQPALPVKRRPSEDFHALRILKALTQPEERCGKITGVLCLLHPRLAPILLADGLALVGAGR
jgi:hypothetical protein